jgi:hypothetical protein
MAIDFPTSPTVGQRFPASPIAGVPTYVWDGEKWVGLLSFGQIVSTNVNGTFVTERIAGR